MRLWSLHPRLLDARGLVALWREALLAQAVLRGRTSGYKHHPQLDRFRDQAKPVASIADYLRGIQREAERRGYRFDASRISRARGGGSIPCTRGQLEYEWAHLRRKLVARDAGWLRTLSGAALAPHDIFTIRAGPVADWERRQVAR
jgi:hypothetical protein